MSFVLYSRWQSLLLDLFGGNVCCWVFYVEMCAVGSFRWQCVLLGLLVAMCVLLGLLGGKVSCWVF